METLAKRISALIAEKGLSYGELEKRTSIPKSALQRYATGATGKIPINRVQSIAKALGTTAEYLMGWAPAATPAPPADGELADYLEELRSRPEQRMLFSVTKNATKEEIMQAVKIIEALRSKGEDE